MPVLFKALIAVMVLTVATFYVARPLMRRFMSDSDFTVRRNVWLGLTLAAFLIPDYWFYVLVASAILIVGLRRDSNPAALYLFLLLAMVPSGLNLPTFGVVNQIFRLDHLRLLSLVILLPSALQLARSTGPSNLHGPSLDRSRLHADLLLLGYVVLQVVLLVRYESFTSTLRRVILIGLDVWLPYYVLSRGCRTREQAVDAMAAFALAMFVLAPLAVVEAAKGWLFYVGLQEHLGTQHIFNYLRRGGVLRATVTSGQPIVLGYAMAVGFGFWLFLQTRVNSRAWWWLAMLTLVAGLIVPSARGPWLGAATIVIVFLALGPNRSGRISKAIVLLTVAGAAILASPYGDTVIDRIPFVGSLDAGAVSYREELAATSWQIIQQNPWFGTPGFVEQMESLRQGQGIIDVVNAYAGIGLAFGLVDVALFLGLFLYAAVQCTRGIRTLRSSDPELSLMGASLVACIAAVLLMLATVNLYLSVGYLTWALAGLAIGYAGIVRRHEGSIAEPGVRPAGSPAERAFAPVRAAGTK